MLLLEAFFKFSAMGLLLALAALICRDGLHVRVFRFAIPLLLAICFMLLATGSPELQVGMPWKIPLRLFDMFTTLFIWWLGRALFDDDFQLSVLDAVVASIYLVLGTSNRLHALGFDVFWLPEIDFALAILTVSLMSHLVYRALVGRQEDLLEGRRQIRVWFALTVALVLVLSVVTERVANLLQLDSRQAIWITYVFTLPILLWAVLWLTRLHPSALAFQTPSTAQLDTIHIDPRDVDAHAKLVRIMESERGFAEQGLTIGGLAKRVGLAEHQLRSLINRSMGYQNFSSFVNHYRILDVQQAMANPIYHRTPILTLAMDAGYSSLAPFNRAFKKQLGITPTEFRAKLMDDLSK
ncbi:helix-turn-helix domain-containing protein [Arenicella xantha]|uniref:AraC-like DNA-binding protein n=1 Tax=Arenicella xantha TaxID=644221 RepID=A0A395JGB4_9GAMM|nr:AraC family transcriptional regulator [Arenicella xantha]RBP48771.1 AraC-like DNA-binding protein [Arenicella xantha]